MSVGDNFEGEDPFDLKCHLKFLLKSEKYEEAKLIVRDDKYSGAISQIIPEIGDIIIEDGFLQNGELFDFCKYLICWFAERTEPNDALYEFIALAESRRDSLFCISLKGMEISLMKLIDNGKHEVMWCLNTIIRHINDMERIEDMSLEDDEFVIQEISASCLKVSEIYKEIFTFLEPIMSFLFKGDRNTNALSDVGNDVLTFLIKLLGRPLIYINLSKGKTKNDFRLLAEEILNYIILFKFDLTHFINFVILHNPRRKTTMSDIVDLDFNNLSLGAMYYLVFSEEIGIERIAYVYDPIFLFESISPLVIDMLIVNHSMVQVKGLLLFKSILQRISNKSLNLSNVNCELFGNICKTLSHIMVYSQIKVNRENAAHAFRELLWKFDSKGRHYILYNIQNEVKQSKFIGYLATLTKNCVSVALNDRDSKDLEYFTGCNLCNILSKFCTLDEGVQTDLLELADQIISSLNFIRYIIIRDKEGLSGIDAFIPELNKYLSTLKTGLELSIAHYKLEEVNLLKEPDDEDGDLRNRKCSKFVSHKQQMNVVNLALTTFDLIKSLVARVEECLAEK